MQLNFLSIYIKILPKKTSFVSLTQVCFGTFKGTIITYTKSEELWDQTRNALLHS